MLLQKFSRRELLQLALKAGAASCLAPLINTTAMNLITAKATLIKRPIPGTGELLPVVGLGTWQTFDVGPSPVSRADVKEVLRLFSEMGGTLIDSSPMYGRSEEVVGDLSVALGLQKKLFMATKVWTQGEQAGIKQMEIATYGQSGTCFVI